VVGDVLSTATLPYGEVVNPGRGRGRRVTGRGAGSGAATRAPPPRVTAHGTGDYAL